MPWNERIREAAYTSPSGRRLVFAYENVSTEFDKKGAVYDFPDADGTYVQDLGRTGRRYPLVVYFSGTDYDLASDLFLAMLGEPGTGKLEHPAYGVVNVVPFGTIGRRDDLKTAANQAAIEVTFWETTGLVYPTSQVDAAGEVLRAVIAYNEASAAQFEASVRLNTPSATAGLIGDYSSTFGNAKRFIDELAEASDSVQRQYTTINRSIVEGLDELVGEPLVLALQTALFLQSPARALSRINSRLEAYGDLIAVLSDTVESPGFGPRNANRFKANDLFASGALSAQVLSLVNNQFATKGDALYAADFVLQQLDVVTVWRENNYRALEDVDTGEAYTQLQSAVALAAGYLVEISFNLKQERLLTLDRARSIVDLVAELYGVVDAHLDFFITSNDLTGSEIIEVPRGRQVAYYV